MLAKDARGEFLTTDFCLWCTSFRGELSSDREGLWTILFENSMEQLFCGCGILEVVGEIVCGCSELP